MKTIWMISAFALVANLAVAQQVEQDDMYFNAKDRAVVLASLPPEFAVNTMKSVKDDNVIAAVLYSGRNANPEYVGQRRNDQQVDVLSETPYFSPAYLASGINQNLIASDQFDNRIGRNNFNNSFCNNYSYNPYGYGSYGYNPYGTYSSFGYNQPYNYRAFPSYAGYGMYPYATYNTWGSPSSFWGNGYYNPYGGYSYPYGNSFYGNPYGNSYYGSPYGNSYAGYRDASNYSKPISTGRKQVGSYDQNYVVGRQRSSVQSSDGGGIANSGGRNYDPTWKSSGRQQSSYQSVGRSSSSYQSNNQNRSFNSGNTYSNRSYAPASNSGRSSSSSSSSGRSGRGG